HYKDRPPPGGRRGPRRTGSQAGSGDGKEDVPSNQGRGPSGRHAGERPSRTPQRPPAGGIATVGETAAARGPVASRPRGRDAGDVKQGRCQSRRPRRFFWAPRANPAVAQGIRRVRPSAVSRGMTCASPDGPGTFVIPAIVCKTVY